MFIPNQKPAAIQLSPSQELAFEGVMNLLPKSPVITLVVQGSLGRTTILRKLEAKLGGCYLSLADVFEQIKGFHPFQLEEGLEKALEKAFQQADCVLIDDFHLIRNQLSGCCYDTARPSIFGFALDAIFRLIVQSGKQLIIGDTSRYIGAPLESHCLEVVLEAFSAADFAHLVSTMGRVKTNRLDYEKIHRFVPQLDARQIQRASHYLQPVHVEDTETFIGFLEAYALHSNVDRQEVEKVSLDDLHGIEDVKRQLEINIIVPFERDDLVKELAIRPKRGVLLYGPPGTGKTTIGRALAHRLGSKFFLIDGTVISGTNRFYYEISNIFEKAKENAPSILFIDDCDLLFENENEPGLYRYLLTMLDGLESKSNGQVTIMLTAMNIGSLPPALIRSGRVELWLETKLPELEARAAIVESKLAGQALHLNSSETMAFAQLAEGLTGSDIARVITDARNLHGYDVAKARKQETAFSYFERALLQLRQHRKQLENAPAFTAAHRPRAVT